MGSVFRDKIRSITHFSGDDACGGNPKRDCSAVLLIQFDPDVAREINDKGPGLFFNSGHPLTIALVARDPRNPLSWIPV
ncbi:hypothetical protein NicSoilB8_45790 (plasmid) [Arthrobacter sp. NicSoilB8]|nr:hypothetical protein NicSoilB8_45790 [Arthrobacter sp. NicSoilB8]